MTDFQWVLEVQEPGQRTKGGPGSGNWRHTGLGGQHGGSDPGGGLGDTISWTKGQEAVATRTATDWYQHWEKSLSGEERHAVIDYTAMGYSPINGILRGDQKWFTKGKPEKMARRSIPALDQALERSSLPETTVTHRGMCKQSTSDCFEEYGSLQPGDEFTDRGYVSTSLISPHWHQEQALQVHITVPKGSKAAYVEAISGRKEWELLIQRGARFRVTGRREEAGKLHIDVILMAQGDLAPIPSDDIFEKQWLAKDQPESDKFTWELGDITIFKKGEKMSGFDWTLEVIAPEASKGGPGSGNWGHGGLPGIWGGSSPGGGLGRVCRRPEGDEIRDGANGTLRISDAMSRETRMTSWRTAARSERGAVKNKLVTALAETSGEPYDTCNKIVKQWSHSSNDTDMRSLAIQRDAGEEFGEDLSDFTKRKIKYMEERASQYPYLGDTPDYHPLYPEDVQRRVLRAEYDNTQKFLREQGIGPDDLVTLYRGSRWRRDVTAGWNEGDEVAFHDNVLASWSLDAGVARMFMRHGTSGKDGVLLRINVPARMIFSTALTGIGCLTEGEVVLLGGRGTAEVMQISKGYD